MVPCRNIAEDTGLNAYKEKKIKRRNYGPVGAKTQDVGVLLHLIVSTVM